MTGETIDGLYRRHAYGVFRRCQMLLRDDDEARDAMQETFLTYLERPARFQGRSSHATYLFGVATHLCLNRLRNRSRRDERWQASVARSWQEASPQGSEAVEARQLLRLILAEADPEAVVMALYHFVDGLSQGEIAALVGRSRVTVNQTLQRLRSQAARRGEGT